MQTRPTRFRPRSGKLRWGCILLPLVVVLLAVDVSELRLLLTQRRIHFPFYADAYVWQPGREPRRVTPDNGIFYQPSVHPDGSSVVLAGATVGPPRIWKADLESDELTPLSPPGEAALHPAFSWDGRSIAFCSDAGSPHPPIRVDELNVGGRPTRPQRFHIWVMDQDGGDLRQVTSGNCTDIRPCFTPDGKTILFVSNRGKIDRLWTVPVDGSEEPRLLYDEGRVYRPWYSADGAWIHCHNLGGDVEHRILRIPAQGGSAERVLEDDFFDRAHGSFVVPEGGMLLVHALREERWGIWEISLDGDATPRRIPIPGFEQAYHGTRSRDGTLAFDLPRVRSLRREWRRCLRF